MNFLPYILVAEQPGPIDTGDGFWFVPPASEYAATHDSIYEFVLWLILSLPKRQRTGLYL